MNTWPGLLCVLRVREEKLVGQLMDRDLAKWLSMLWPEAVNAVNALGPVLTKSQKCLKCLVSFWFYLL